MQTGRSDQLELKVHKDLQDQMVHRGQLAQQDLSDQPDHRDQLDQQGQRDRLGQLAQLVLTEL